MIDIKRIRSDFENVKKAVQSKGYDVSTVEDVLALDKQYRDFLQTEQELSSQRNKKSQQPAGESRQAALEIKEKLKDIRAKRVLLEKEIAGKLNQIPNIPLQEVPIGKGEKDNVEVRKWGNIKKFSFQPQDHFVIAQQLGIIDFEAGARVAGSQFYYLDNEGVLLELALIQYALSILMQAGYTPTMTPDLAKSRYYLGTGYLPKGKEAQIYTLADEDLGLIATAEVTLAARHADEIIPEASLPVKYAGVSHCFRKEAGAYGKYSKGLYRVHQFTKVEMFAYCLPEDSSKFHTDILAIEERIWQGLGIPYRVLEMCTGDLGAIAARKFDIEAWMPGRGEYGEVTSASNCTDYQARNLNIRGKRGKGSEYLHMLNGTAIAVSRAIIAILENFQNEDGSVAVPEVLQPFMGGFKKIQPRSQKQSRVKK